MYGSLYAFVRGREPVTPEEVASEFLSRPDLNGAARTQVERIVGVDPRFLWNADGTLRTADLISVALDRAPYVVFDLETTGFSGGSAGITEIGAVKILGNEIVERFSTFVNPERPIDPFVVRLTGITDRMVAGAPVASEVMPLFERFAEGTVLVGHNVSFDCSFVTAAREAAGLAPLPNPVLDTLKLARILVPGLRRYRLSALASHFGVRQVPNHRALSDATATAEILLRLIRMLCSAGVGSVGEAAHLRRQGTNIKPQKQHFADGLPDAPGVYYFLDKKGEVFYVGKAKSLRTRVRTYFNGGDGRRKIPRIVREVAEVRYRKTGSELKALVLEAREIRRLQPRYNSAERGEEQKRWFLSIDTGQPYPVPERVSSNEPEDGVILLGPYRGASSLDTCVEALGRVMPLRRCDGAEGPCLYGQMGRCAPCTGMSVEDYAREVVGGIAALLRGEGGEAHLAALINERERLASELEFEAAARLRDLIAGIERVRLARTVMDADGIRAAVSPSTEPGVVEVFILRCGRLVAHEGFEATDEAGITAFAAAINTSKDNGDSDGVDEAQVVAAYLRRRQAPFEVAVTVDKEELLAIVRRVMGYCGETNVASLA